MAEVIIAFDLETTGLEPATSEIVEIGAVPIIEGVVREDCAFHALVDPDRPIPAEASAIHGITDSMVHGKPRIDVVLPELLRYLGAHDLLGHNIEFDMGFVRTACRRLELAPPQGRQHDTLLISRQVHPGERRHNLDDACRRLGIEIGTRHRSIDDVLLTCRLFMILRDRVAERAT